MKFNEKNEVGFSKLKTKIEWCEVKIVDFVADKEEVVWGPVVFVKSSADVFIKKGRVCGLISESSGPLIASITMTVIDTSNIFQIDRKWFKFMLEHHIG